VIRHTGRSTREPYETPVGAVATEDGFVIALVDGRGTDWLENLLASGSDECLRVRRVEREAAAAQRPGPR
jgi:deazaflavin-dependent oxidoreductase (nitroreductase family)